MPGGGVPYQVREWGRQLLDLLRVEIDELQCAVEQAPMDLLLGLQGSQGAWCGLGNPRGVLGSKCAPLAMDERNERLSRQGQHMIGVGTPMEPMMEELARGRRWAQGRFRVVLEQQVGTDAFDPSPSLMPQSTQWPCAPLEQPREFFDFQRQWFWKPSWCREPAGQKFSNRRTVDVIVLLTRSRRLCAMMRDRSRIDHRSCNM
jgi:hypothetical protein